jgi:hypothetical protein
MVAHDEVVTLRDHRRPPLVVAAEGSGHESIGSLNPVISHGIKPKSPKNSTGIVHTNQFRRRRAASHAVQINTATPATANNPIAQFIAMR